MGCYYLCVFMRTEEKIHECVVLMLSSSVFGTVRRGSLLWQSRFPFSRRIHLRACSATLHHPTNMLVSGSIKRQIFHRLRAHDGDRSSKWKKVHQAHRAREMPYTREEDWFPGTIPIQSPQERKPNQLVAVPANIDPAKLPS
jgi:hypothetical protein